MSAFAHTTLDIPNMTKTQGLHCTHDVLTRGTVCLWFTRVARSNHGFCVTAINVRSCRSSARQTCQYTCKSSLEFCVYRPKMSADNDRSPPKKRFLSRSKEEIRNLIYEQDSANTKKNTEHSVRMLREFCTATGRVEEAQFETLSL